MKMFDQTDSSEKVWNWEYLSTSVYVVGVISSLDTDRLTVLSWVWQQVTVDVALGSQGRRNLRPGWITW